MFKKILFVAVLCFSNLSLAQIHEIHWERVEACMEIKKMISDPALSGDRDHVQDAFKMFCSEEDISEAFIKSRQNALTFISIFSIAQGDEGKIWERKYPKGELTDGGEAFIQAIKSPTEEFPWETVVACAELVKMKLDPVFSPEEPNIQGAYDENCSEEDISEARTRAQYEANELLGAKKD